MKRAGRAAAHPAPIIINVRDDLARFAAALPMWCDAETGMPKSWRHFIVGLDWLDVDDARTTLQLHHAVRVGMSSMDDRGDHQDWIDAHKTAGHLPFDG